VSAPVRVIDGIQEQKHKDELVCPHCENHSVVRFGKYTVQTRAGVVKRQRYRCKSCLQTFNDLTNTPLQRTRRPHLWVRFIEFMLARQGRLPYPKRKQLPQPLEEMDGPLQWCCNQIFATLFGLVPLYRQQGI